MHQGLPRGPFSTEVAALADRMNVPLGPNAATRLQRHTAGLALHVRTLLRELTPEQLNQFGALPAPRSLAQTTVGRIAALPPMSIELVRALAVLGRPVRLITLGRVAGIADPSAALEDAIGSDIVEWASTGPVEDVRFAHPLYAAAIYDDIPPVQRRRLHLAAAAVDERSALTHRIAATDRADEGLAVELETVATSSDTATAVRLLAASSDVSPAPVTPRGGCWRLPGAAWRRAMSSGWSRWPTASMPARRAPSGACSWAGAPGSAAICNRPNGSSGRPSRRRRRIVRARLP